MDMQDNEFDGLFRDKLNGFESEPSERVWTGIDAGLENKKRSILPWLSIAASIIVLAGAGILFIPKGHKVNQTGENLTKIQPKTDTAKLVEQVAVNTARVTKEEPVKQALQTGAKRNKQITIAIPAKSNEVIANNEPAKTAGQPVIASVATKTEPTIQVAVVPGPETQLVVKQNINIDSGTTINKPVLIAKAQPEVRHMVPAIKKHGIRNFGDLVNLVVAKVDRRKDKAVQFTDDEDGDGSTLTAVNIGPLKIGQDDKGDR
jgi:hypothetical protein